jgi:hypothetical protein
MHSYRPTVHYVYHPCDDAVKSLHELAGKNLKQQSRQRLIKDEVVAGGLRSPPPPLPPRITGDSMWEVAKWTCTGDRSRLRVALLVLLL